MTVLHSLIFYIHCLMFWLFKFAEHMNISYICSLIWQTLLTTSLLPEGGIIQSTKHYFVGNRINIPFLIALTSCRKKYDVKKHRIEKEEGRRMHSLHIMIVYIFLYICSAFALIKSHWLIYPKLCLRIFVLTGILDFSFLTKRNVGNWLRCMILSFGVGCVNLSPVS